jgi:hypothetical protein
MLIVALHCTLRDLFDHRNYLATEERTCWACGKPSTKSCGQCRIYKYCSKAMIPRRIGLFNRSVKNLIGKKDTNANARFSKL